MQQMGAARRTATAAAAAAAAVLVWAAAVGRAAADCSALKDCAECVGQGCVWATKWDSTWVCAKNPDDSDFNVTGRFWHGSPITSKDNCTNEAKCLSTTQTFEERNRKRYIGHKQGKLLKGLRTGRLTRAMRGKFQGLRRS